MKIEDLAALFMTKTIKATNENTTTGDIICYSHPRTGRTGLRYAKVTEVTQEDSFLGPFTNFRGYFTNSIKDSIIAYYKKDNYYLGQMSNKNIDIFKLTGD